MNLYNLEVYSKDYADLSERDFAAMLSDVSNLSTLEGIANRRRLLNAPHLKRWSKVQRELILNRKWELENGK